MKHSGLSAAISLVVVAGCVRTAAGPGEPEQPPGLSRVLASTDIDGQVIGAPAPATRATVVVVFASWCYPCRHELAMLGEIAAAEPALRVIGLNAYESWGEYSDEQRLRAFLARYAPWLQVVVADDSILRSFGGVPKIPTLFVFDGEGREVIAFRRNQRKPPTRAELERAVERAMREPG